MSDKVEEPQAFICPINNTIMDDPVIGTDGNSYEREAIVNWLKVKQISPLTNEPMFVGNLKTNRNLRDAIQEWKKNSGYCDKVDIKDTINTVDTNDIGIDVVTDAIPQYIDISMSSNPKTNDVLVTLSSSTDEKILTNLPKLRRLNIDLVCVIDVSGSMSTEATMLNDSGQMEKHGLSILDVVKHAIRTIFNCLDDTDRLGIVKFSTDAVTVLELQEVGKSRKGFDNILDKMVPTNSTNIWDGLHKGLELLKNRKDTEGRNSALMLFTDGLPNERPPRGEVDMLKRYINALGANASNNVCPIYTFGFGYQLDSALLDELSMGGTYSYIPDSALLGSVIINTLSTVLSTAATNVKLAINVPEKNGLNVYGEYQLNFDATDEYSVYIDVGFIQYSQSKDIVFNLGTTLENSQIIAKVEYIYGGKRYESSQLFNFNEVVNSGNVDFHKMRLKIGSNIKNAMNLMKTNHAEAIKVIGNMSTEMHAMAESDDRIKKMILDVDDQVTIAVKRKDFYDRWGQHYLPSLSRAHQYQICNNFKDPGVQQYGGDLFLKLRDKADDIFNSLPPPKPSCHNVSVGLVGSYGNTNTQYKRSAGKHGGHGAHGYQYNSSLSSMKAYNTSSVPCFDGDCDVLMFDNTTKKIRDIRKGDKVKTPDGSATVQCVVKTILDKTIDIVRLENGLLITPWHPVRINNRWCFPGELVYGQRTETIDPIYSFVISNDHIMIINSVECVTLGHDFKEDVVRHPYFGSSKVIDDLRNMDGWVSGHIELKQGCTIKDGITGLVKKLV